MTANAPGADSQFGAVPYKILSCPVMHGAQRVLGILALFKPPQSPDFDLRQVRLVELLARRVAYILMNAYDPTTGLLTRSAFEKRAQSPADAADAAVEQLRHLRRHRPPARAEREPRHARRRRGDRARRGRHPPQPLAAHARGPHLRRPLRALRAGDASIDTTQDIAENLRRRSRATRASCDGTQSVDVSASFGVARVVEGKHPLSHALAAAEIACKAAKDRGRDRVEIYDDSDQSIVRRYTDMT